MKRWEKFEIDATDGLNAKYGDIAKFERQGGSDSTVSDILVKDRDDHDLFYIECKSENAQSGQFVLVPDAKAHKFSYSAKNHDAVNDSAAAIMDFMNEHYDTFAGTGTAPKTIDIDDAQDVFSDWIKDHYVKKGARFFATQCNGQNRLVPVEDVGKAFIITANYRVKKSGSRHVAKCDQKAVVSAINGMADVDGVGIDDGRIVCTSDKDIAGSRFEIDGKEYMMSAKGTEDGKYTFEPRALGTTKNANVIFSLAANPDYQGVTPAEFRDAIGKACEAHGGNSAAAKRSSGGGGRPVHTASTKARRHRTHRKSGSGKDMVWVDTYVRSDGATVHGHWRRNTHR